MHAFSAFHCVFENDGKRMRKWDVATQLYLLLNFQKETNESIRAYEMSNYRKKKEQFDSIFDPEIHRGLVARGERRLSLKALQGALMISLYREEPRFHQPHNLLGSLMDIDSLLHKWRCNNLEHMFFAGVPEYHRSKTSFTGI